MCIETAQLYLLTNRVFTPKPRINTSFAYSHQYLHAQSPCPAPTPPGPSPCAGPCPRPQGWGSPALCPRGCQSQIRVPAQIVGANPLPCPRHAESVEGLLVLVRLQETSCEENDMQKADGVGHRERCAKSHAHFSREKARKKGAAAAAGQRTCRKAKMRCTCVSKHALAVSATNASTT